MAHCELLTCLSIRNIVECARTPGATSHVVAIDKFDGDFIKFESSKIEVLKNIQGDTDENTMLWIPGQRILMLAFDVVCVMRERTPLPRNVIERLPNLKLIASTGSVNFHR